MSATRFRYSLLLLLWLVSFLLNACASGSGTSDPPVTPDTTIPSTIQVNVTIAEDQEASDGANGMSVITLGFNTNETIPPSQIIFINGESVSCKTNNKTNSMNLGNFTSYWFRVAIPYSSTYTCSYHYFLKGKPAIASIFSFQAPQKPLSPVLLKPVGNNSDFKVRYNPGNPIPNTQPCKVQVAANAPNQTVQGDNKQQGGNIYTGPDVSTLNGLGNIVMTRTCTPIDYNHDNDADDTGLKIAAVTITYTSTASYEVSWNAPGSPTQGTNS